MRCFLALPLLDHTRDALSVLQRELRVGRPVARDNLHLTLAFLDDQTDDMLEELHGELEALRLPSFELTLNGTGCFGGAAPRTIFAKASLTPGLGALHSAVLGCTRRVGLSLPRRRFQPHVTFARLKPYDAPGVAPFLQAHAGFRHEAGVRDSFALYESVLRPEGAEYHLLAQYPLRG